MMTLNFDKEKKRPKKFLTSDFVSMNMPIAKIQNNFPRIREFYLFSFYNKYIRFLAIILLRFYTHFI